MEENNKNLIQETLENIKKLKNTVKKNEIKCFLSKETDSNDCFLEIHAGAGGTESQDWAEMLRRMYMKLAQSKEFKNHIISEHKGDEAGLKSSTIKISGDYVFGWLKTESGIHRLVRISPFDSGARRHTSFFIFMLGSFILTLYDYFCWKMCNPDCTVSSIYVLSTRSTRSVCINS